MAREPEQVRRYGSLIHSQGVRLTRMVEQVLELAGILSGQPSYALRETSPGAVVEAAVAASRFLLEEAGCTLELRVDAGLPAVMADPDALQRAVQNLIGNAVKYGGEDRWLAVEAMAEGAEVVVRVADHGPGITREDLPHLFKPFYRSRRAREAQVPGSGLGLSLVRHVIEAHGGKVEARSEPDRGSTFTLRLPAVPAQVQAAREVEEGFHGGQEDLAG